MGRITDFDHFDVGEDLDIASWDSYPLGFLLDRAGATETEKNNFLRQGDPDFQAFHHDLYRAVCGGRWWVMEQQPGPVNWAPYNPEPLPGMVRLWTWEAFAHGAETVHILDGVKFLLLRSRCIQGCYSQTVLPHQVILRPGK